MIANKNFLGPLAALPVEFMDFTLTKKGANAVSVNWSTATELNNDHFTVERSTDGLNFTGISKVKGAGTSSSVNHYQVTDAGLPAQVIYYRIRQTDLDGKSSYSAIRSVDLSGKTNTLRITEIYPNPFSSDLYISIAAVKGKPVKTEIMDLNGKTLLSQQHTVVTGENKLHLNVEELKHGSYLLRVSDEQGSQVIKILK